MKMLRLSMFIIPLALAAAPALAHEHGKGDACRQDVKKLCSTLSPTPAPGPGSCIEALCPNTTPGAGGFVSCLLDKYGSSLSSQCTQNLKDVQSMIATKLAAFNAACSSDVSAFCSNVTSGPWVQGQCLHQAIINNQKVSANCQTFLAQHHKGGPRGHGFGHGPNGPQGEGPAASESAPGHSAGGPRHQHE